MPDMKFTNYLPMNKEMRLADLLPSNRTKEIEGHIQIITDRIVNEFLNEDTKPTNILPKKTNADLKRFLHKRFDKLNKRTEIAVIELLSEDSFICSNLLGEKMLGLRIEEPIRKVEPAPISKPLRDEPRTHHNDHDDEEDYDEARDDTLGANLLEGMRVHDKIMRV